jgi:hypothetical protein
VVVVVGRAPAPAVVRPAAVTRARELIRLQHDLTGQPVAVVPVLVSTGEVSQEKFPKDLTGLPVVYRGEGLLPHPGMARWVESRMRESWPAAGPSAQDDAAPSPMRP